MTELARRDATDVAQYSDDPTGGRLIAWAQAATAANQLARALVATTFVPASFKGNVGDATAVILMGDELGLSPLASLRSIYAVHGTPALYARTMVALALAHGHQVWTEKSTDTEVAVCGQRRGSDKIERSTWTIARAQKAGYTKNAKYGSNGAEMLYSKAAGEVCRKIAADVLAGVPYSVEDLELSEPEPTTTVKRTAKVQRAPLAVAPEPDLEPAPESEPNPAPITDPQSKKMHVLYNSLEFDRDARLEDASRVVGREVLSSSELSKDEATRLLDDLAQRVPDEPDDQPSDPLFRLDS